MFTRLLALNVSLKLDLLEIEALSVDTEARAVLFKRLNLYKDDVKKLSEHAVKCLLTGFAP